MPAVVTGKPAASATLPRDVEALGALRHRAAHDHVVDLAGLDTGALDGVPDGMAAKCRCFSVVERTAIGLADRRACGRHDDCFSH